MALTLPKWQRRKIREFLAERGMKVEFLTHGYKAGEPSEWGWRDYRAEEHHRTWQRGSKSVVACPWVIPEGASLKEVVRMQVADTMDTGTDEVGLEVAGCACRCGEYQDITIRWLGSMTELMGAVFGPPDGDGEVGL